MPSACAAAVAVSCPERTWKITSARCLALAFIYSVFAGAGCGLASLLICSKRLVSLVALRERWRFWSKAWSRGLKASPLVRLTRFSSAWSMPSMARRCHCWKVIQLMWSWRQTSAGLARSVHTASTACAFSWALKFGLDLRGARVLVLGWGWGLSLFMGGLDLRVVGEFLRGGVERIGDTELELALLGAEHDGLSVHAADHVEGRLGFAAQRQFEQVVGNALLDGGTQLGLDLEEAVGEIGRAHV